MCTADVGHAIAIAEAMQNRIAIGAADTVSHGAKAVEMTGRVESVEKQKRLFPSFHRPLGISQTTRDAHIPTARLRPGWERGKPKAGFPLSHAGLAKTISALFFKPKYKKGDRPLRGLLLTIFQDHRVLETEPDFRIIFRLENAVVAPRAALMLCGNAWGAMLMSY